jgi:hypothetical protein
MQLTHFLAQLFGLYCLIVSTAMFAQKRAMIEIVTNLIQNRLLLLVVEVLGLIGGLAMVLGHSVWSAGLLAFVVTFIGWVTFIRSVLLLFLPSGSLLRFMRAIRYEQNYHVFVTIVLIFGIYLTVAGFAK